MPGEAGYFPEGWFMAKTKLDLEWGEDSLEHGWAMGKDKLHVEWSIVEDEREWPSGQPPAAGDDIANAESTSSRASRRELLLTALVVALFLPFAGTWAWHRQTRQATTANKLQTASAQQMSTQ